MLTFAVISMIMLILILISSNNSYEYNKNVIMDKKLTTQLKGIAIIFVLLAHMTLMTFLNYRTIGNFGAIGVDIFLLLSGYGLYKSYEKKGINKDFIIKRVSTIYVPFIIAVIIDVFLKIYICNIRFSLKQILFFLSGFGANRILDGTYWYISFILLWYFVFCLIYKFSRFKNLNLILLFYFSYLFYLSNFMYNVQFLTWQFSLHFIAFPLGVLIATHEKKLIRVLIPDIYKLSIIILLITCFFTHYIYRFNSDYYWLYDLNIALLVIFIFLFLQSYNIMSKFLEFIGNISYGIYLVEMQILTYFYFPSIVHNKIIGDIIELILCLVAGFLLDKLSKTIKTLIFNKNKKIHGLVS